MLKRPCARPGVSDASQQTWGFLMTRLTSRLILGTLSLATSMGCAPDTGVEAYSLDALQGAWWSDCEAPAAEFLIAGDEYSGDFEGSYQVTLTGDVLRFDDGLADGHSVEVTHVPLEFRIVELSDARLVLSPLPGNPVTDDWHLQSCDAAR